MSIAAQRFKFLDKETNVPVKDYYKVTDNQVYNTIVQAADSAVDSIRDNDGVVKQIQEGLNDIEGTLASGGKEGMTQISNALNTAIDGIGKLELPGFVKDIFNSVKELDLSGVKSFIKDTLHIGSKFLCNNLDFLKFSMLGYALNKNIMAGILTGLLLTWFDRYCKSFNRKEAEAASNKKKIEMMFPGKEKQLNKDNVFEKTVDALRSVTKSKSELMSITPATPLSTSDFLTSVTSGSVNTAISNLRNSELSHTDKNTYKTTLTSALSSYSPNSPEYNNILKGIGDLNKVPMISEPRREANIKYSNVSDELGRTIKGLDNVDTTKISQVGTIPVEKDMIRVINEMKNNSKNSKDFNTRNNNSGSFDNFNFDTVVPPLSQEQKDYLNSKESKDATHRFNELHPTSEVYITEMVI